MILSDKWIKRALQHKGIKGEHAYLEAIKDVIKELEIEIEKTNKKYIHLGYNSTYIKREVLKNFKLDIFNTNKKKK